MIKVFFAFFLITIHTNALAQQGGSHGGNGIKPPPNPVSGGNTLPPAGSNVIVYKEMKYNGMSRALGDGNFNTQTLGFIGSNISSVYIPQGTTLTVYDNRGASRIFTISVANLAQYGWDNKITSGNITRGGFGGGSGGQHGGNGGGNRPPPPPPFNAIVTFYRDAYYRGEPLRYGTGKIAHLGIGNDRTTSSIHITRGFAVRVYSGILFTGHFRTFHSSVSNLSHYGWNDLIRSVEVIRL